MTWHQLPAAAQNVAGPVATEVLQDLALRGEAIEFERTWSQRLEHCTSVAETGFCTIDPDAFAFCSEVHEGGGIARCVGCGRPVFIGPATCLERIRSADDEIDAFFDRGTGRIVL